MEHHESAIWKFLHNIPKHVSEETLIMTGLAHDLFSQLVPNRKYEVDRYVDQLPKTCTCGCDGEICEGDTSLGSIGTWHGSVDIMVNDVIAVTIKKGGTVAEDDEAEDESPKKHRKLETDRSCDISDEVECNRRHETVLLEVKVLSETLAEAITNGSS